MVKEWKCAYLRIENPDMYYPHFKDNDRKFNNNHIIKELTLTLHLYYLLRHTVKKLLIYII